MTWWQAPSKWMRNRRKNWRLCPWRKGRAGGIGNAGGEAVSGAVGCAGFPGWPGGGAAGEGHISGGVGSGVGAGPPTAQGDGLNHRLFRRCPVDCLHRNSGRGSGSGKRRFVRPDFARRSIEARTEGPVSAFLWISKTVSFGAYKRNGFWRMRSKGADLGLCLLSVRTESRSPSGET